MVKKGKKGTTLSLTDFTQQVQQQQQRQLAEQQQQRLQQQQQRNAALQAKTKQSKTGKKKTNEKVNKNETKPSTPQSQQKVGSNFKPTGECKTILDAMKNVLGNKYSELIDEPILNYLASVIQGQNKISTMISEKKVLELLETYFMETIGMALLDNEQNDFISDGPTELEKGYEKLREKANHITCDIMDKLKEQNILKIFQDTTEEKQVKILEEAVNLGKHFEDELKQQQKMIKSITGSNASMTDEESAGNFNDKLDWDDKVNKAKLEKKKKKLDKEQQQKLKEYNEYLKSRGISNSKGIVKIHNSDTIGGTRDILSEKVTITVGSKDLLNGAQLILHCGKRYGLIGRNGVGKTTLLRHIVEREIDGIPPYLQILHIEQEVIGDNNTALEAVLKTDVERERLLAEEQKLLDSTDDESAQRLAEIYTRMDEIDAHSAESRAASILSGLQFTTEMQKMKTKQFSGGWRMRIALARALFVEPDVLLLDEPTNHLDLHAVLWLENYLQKWKKTLVIVSHSRSFLNAVASDVIHFTDNELKYYKGNYDTFEKTRMELLKQQQKTFEAQQKQIKHVQSFIDRFRYKAATAKMVQSRIKMLEKMEFVAAVAEDPTFSFQIPSPEPSQPPYVQSVGVTFGYSAEKILFKDLDFYVDNDSRIALVGANGTGKSTFMNVLCGDLKPLSGVVNLNRKIRVAKFSQHHMEHLTLSQTPLEYMKSKYPTAEEQLLRSHLGGTGISGSLALQPIYTLSGGQKSRVVFAELTFKKPHLLLLDEPTNHLDLDTVDALIQALNEYTGGVVLISHDEHLINCVCDEIWVCEGGSINKFNGDFNAYKKTLQIKF